MQEQDNSLVEDKNQIVDHVVGFYESLYKENHKWRPRLDGVNLASVSIDENHMLEGCISEDEVWQAIKALGEDKAPALMGFLYFSARSVGPLSNAIF